MKLFIILALILPLALLPLSASAQPDSPEMPAPKGKQENAFAELEGLVALLLERLRENPENANDWLMLARSYTYMDKPAKAAEAFGQARQQFGVSPELLTSEAEYLMLAAGGQLDESAKALVKRALEMRPGFGRALWLAGIAHYQRSDYEQAGRYWQQLLAQVSAGSESESMVREALDDLADRGVVPAPQENGTSGH
jgi:cytochrome c-type biogenesis protein CcmH